MKILSLTIQNIGIIKKGTLKLDNPLTIIYGEIKQGKSTYLNAIRWAFGGSFPKDIITHGETEASIIIQLDSGMIMRSFYFNKDGEITSRPQKIILNNRPASVNDLKRYLNPFLLDQEHLVKLKAGNERAQFINEIFQINTSEIDKELMAYETKAQGMRATIKAFGDVEVNPVTEPNIDALFEEKKKIEKDIQEQKQLSEPENKKIREDHENERQLLLDDIVKFNNEQKLRDIKIKNSTDLFESLLKQIKGSIFEKCFDIDCAKRLLLELPKAQPEKQLKVDLPEPTFITIDESGLIDINNRINEAKTQKILYDQYVKDESRKREKEIMQGQLREIEGIIKRMRLEKQHAQEEINGIIEGLEYKDFQLWYENTSFEMLSTSQLMTLSSKLSSMYSESLGIELIDKGESLGKSVFDLINKAEKEEKNILVTVVGDKPAEIPENIGVFVVEKGDIK